MSTTIYTPIRPTHEGAPPETPDAPDVDLRPDPADMTTADIEAEMRDLEGLERHREANGLPRDLADSDRLDWLESERQDRENGRLGFGPYADCPIPSDARGFVPQGAATPASEDRLPVPLVRRGDGGGQHAPTVGTTLGEGSPGTREVVLDGTIPVGTDPTDRTPRTAEVGGDGASGDGAELVGEHFVTVYGPLNGYAVTECLTEQFAASLETAEHDHEMPEAA